jgi:hypothetical protein
MVLSPAFAQQHGSNWSAASLAQLLEHLSQLHSSIVFIVTQVSLPSSYISFQTARKLKINLNGAEKIEKNE